ncbi:hypothetical protein GCM10008090_14900 [Arenicella chitinivorans]|uniref:Secreted protein n=1 Tax=Arenicella chitinivorans TaxID=1329800 RepID=A0A918RMZ2_9GAMM|nr:hypothetical protein [Arenicella chitinivorans]GHA06253.1 hypothetical protein GCM10008090_14900 [Arenicella chitinivorans]
MWKFILLSIFLISDVSFSAEFSTYKYDKGRLCFSSQEVYEHRSPKKSRSPKHEIFIKVSGFNVAVRQANKRNPSTATSLFMWINDLNVSGDQYLRRDKRITNFLNKVSPLLNEELGLLVYQVEQESIRGDYFFLAESLNLGDDSISEVPLSTYYVGDCPTTASGLQFECRFRQIFDESLIIEYDFARSALPHWRDIQSHVESRLLEAKQRCNEDK